jgi:type II secretory pathway pseudopilin PulG
MRTLVPSPARTHPGQSLVEVIVATAVLALLIGALVPLTLHGTTTIRRAQERMIAAFAAEEGMEAVRSVVNRGYGNLVNGTYGLTEVNGFYAFAGSPDHPGGGAFTRTITVSSVYRDASGNVFGSPGAGRTLDPNATFVAVSVQWSPGDTAGVRSVSLSTFFTPWR